MEELNKYSKSNPFKVPDGYFDNFQANLKEKLDQDQDNEKGSKWNIHSIKPLLAIAASFLLIFSFWFFLLDYVDKDQKISQEKSEQLPELKYFESVNSDELIEMVSSEGLISPDFNINIEQDMDILIDQFEESTIMDAI